jgi:hypothetical protein
MMIGLSLLLFCCHTKRMVHFGRSEVCGGSHFWNNLLSNMYNSICIAAIILRFNNCESIHLSINRSNMKNTAIRSRRSRFFLAQNMRCRGHTIHHIKSSHNNGGIENRLSHTAGLDSTFWRIRGFE